MSKSPISAAYKSLLDRGRLGANTQQAALVNRLSKLQTTLTTNEEQDAGLYIYGSVGTGKSRIADLFSSTMPRNVSHRRIHFHEFMMDIHSRLHKAHNEAGYAGDPLLKIGQEVRQESRVLCFDEFQVSDIADAMILKRLFGSIWDAGGVMVATSNRHPDDLYEKGLNRPLFVPFIKELQRRCEVWKMEGNQDYRMATRGQEEQRDQVFFTDKKEFEKSLASITNEQPLKDVVIPVMMGRHLNVKALTLGNKKVVVQATFNDLCEHNLGSSDYYALCKKANVLYLSGLRKFKEDQLDYVRRFITLCDLAYENRTRIVCHSDVELFQVFANIIPTPDTNIQSTLENMSVRKGGGSSSSMMSTFIGEMEWSATGLPASLAQGGAGESDVKFAVSRAVSRLFEMGAKSYGVSD